MVKLFVVALFAIMLEAKDVTYWSNMFNNLAYSEKYAIAKTFVKAKEYDLEYSMAAIHFKETIGDRYRINVNDLYSIDVGSFSVNTKMYLKLTNRKINKWNTARAIEELLDYETNFYEAKNVLKWWLNYHKGNYRKAYASYNGGFNGNNKYAEDIINIIKVLRVQFATPIRLDK